MTARKYKDPVCAFSLVGTHVETQNSRYAKKMSGSTLAGIFNISPFNTPFQQACNLMGICREDLDGKTSIEVGKALEEPIIDYLGERYPEYGLFVPAKTIFGKKEGEHDTWKSDFDDTWFSGNMDGMVFDGDMDLENPDGYILEIKTTSNYESWANGVPEYYKVQVALYNHFLPHPKDKAFVAVCLVDDATRRDTTSWVGNDNNVFLFEMPIDEEETKKMIDRAIAWYKEYVLKGITPEYDPSNKGDADMWAHLVAITSGDIQSDIDRLEELEAELEEKEAALKDMQDEREMLRNKIKDYMVTNKRTAINTSSGRFVATVSESQRTSIDKKRMVEDGLDIKRYTVTKVVQTFSLKPLKNEEAEVEVNAA